MSYVIPIGGFLLVICLASWQVGEWVSRLVPPVAWDGNIIQISWPALTRAEYCTSIFLKLALYINICSSRRCLLLSLYLFSFRDGAKLIFSLIRVVLTVQDVHNKSFPLQDSANQSFLPSKQLIQSFLSSGQYLVNLFLL